jgi:2,3-bisphosphoglycerate-independent phosphoglycerate mutase
MGNSEVGHQNIGAGRIVMQDLPRIDRAVHDGSLARNPALLAFIDKLKASGGACHLMGLLSPGGVHSHQDHMAALARIVAGRGVEVKVHAFLDGRDTPPRSAQGYVARFLADIKVAPKAAIATVSGRYYAMDRDKRWERVARAYAALVGAEGSRAKDAAAAIEASYAANKSDEFVAPTALGDYSGMRDGDGVLMANFRADRARELLTALLDPQFDGFARARVVRFAAAVGVASYSEALDAFMPALFPPEALRNTLGEVAADAGLKQLRIAETEKYAHVTFFLNGGEERVFAGEDRILAPSPKVATYDLKPEMAAPEVTDRLVEAIRSGKYDLIVVNYANPDIVGHTGDLKAAIAAAEAIDACLGRLEAALREAGGTMLVTADHGNLELMRDPATGQAHTAHTTNPVPVLLVNPPRPLGLRDGCLADVAPTLLELLGLPKPAEMTGASLLAAAQSREGARATA